VNHRIFERTLRPLVFHWACLFERHFKPQALLGVGRLSRRFARGLASKPLAAGILDIPHAADRAKGIPGAWRPEALSPKFDLGSGRDTR
jgi:hypothetical protein